MSTMALSTRRVAKNALSQVVTFGLSGASKAVVAVLVARWLGPHSFGTFTLVWTIASMLSFFSPLGLDQLLIRELNRSAGRYEIEISLPLATLVGGAFAAAMAMGPLVVGAGHEMTAAFMAGGAFVVLSAPVLIFRACFHARERMELETMGLAIEGVVSAVVVAVVLAAGAGVPAALLALSAGRLANLIVSATMYSRLFGSPRPRLVTSRWMEMLRVSIPMGFGYIFHTLMIRFDVVMLALMRSPEDVGLYTSATVIVLTIPMFATAFNTSLYPVLSRATGDDDPELLKVFTSTWNALLVLGCACAAGLTVLAAAIVDLFYGGGFAEAAWIVAALAWVLPLRSVNNLCGVVLNATDRATARTRAIATAAGLNLGVNLPLIPLLGIRGVVISTLVTEVVLTGLLVRALPFRRPSLARPLTAGLSVAALVGVTVSLVEGHVFVRAGIGAALCGVLVALAVWARGLSGLRVGEVSA